MGYNPVHLLYRWANRRAVEDAAEARRQRNIASREEDRARRDARGFLEEQGFAVIESKEYEGLRRQLREAQEESASLRRRLGSVVSKEKYAELERKLSQATGNIRGLQQQLTGMVPRSALDQQRTRAEQAEDYRALRRDGFNI